MTYEERRRLALNAEIAKLREIAVSFRRLAVEAQGFAQELDVSVRRFQAIADDDETLNQKIDNLDKLAATRRRIAETKGDLRGTIIDISRTLGGL